MAYPLERTANMGPNETLGGKQRHLGVVGDCAPQALMWWEIRNPLREFAPDRIKCQELDFGTQTVAQGTTEKA